MFRQTTRLLAPALIAASLAGAPAVASAVTADQAGSVRAADTANAPAAAELGAEAQAAAASAVTTASRDAATLADRRARVRALVTRLIQLKKKGPVDPPSPIPPGPSVTADPDSLLAGVPETGDIRITVMIWRGGHAAFDDYAVTTRAAARAVIVEAQATYNIIAISVDVRIHA